jgi:hypothetical protein
MMRPATLLIAGVALAIAQPVTGAPKGGVVVVEHRDPAALPSRGPVNALVTIELFFAPGAQISRVNGYRNLERLQANHPSRIRLIYRVVKSGGQTRVPYATLHAHAEGKFFEFMDAINVGRMNPDNRELFEIAKKIGLDPDRVAQVIAKPPTAYDLVLDANERRRSQRIRGQSALPSALFNGRAPTTSLSSLSMADLEREYNAARELAEELLDRGADRGSLAAAFDDQTHMPDEIVVNPGPTDEDIGDDIGPAVLATPPLDLRGMPSYGPLEAATTIAILCSPVSSNCAQPMRAARIIQELYPDAVRVVWAPYFDFTREDAADLSMLGDAAICAEKIGITVEREADFAGAGSPGWRWVEGMFAENNRRRTAPDKIIDNVAKKLRVDASTFATCRAQIAGTSVAWSESARRAGVRVTPSTVVGGRIYGPITDRSTLQLLVEAELAPGILGEAAPAWRTESR